MDDKVKLAELLEANPTLDDLKAQFQESAIADLSPEQKVKLKILDGHHRLKANDKIKKLNKFKVEVYRYIPPEKEDMGETFGQAMNAANDNAVRTTLGEQMKFLRMCCQRRGIGYKSQLTDAQCLDIGLQLNVNKTFASDKERRSWTNTVRNQLYFMVAYPESSVDFMMYVTDACIFADCVCSHKLSDSGESGKPWVPAGTINLNLNMRNLGTDPDLSFDVCCQSHLCLSADEPAVLFGALWS